MIMEDQQGEERSNSQKKIRRKRKIKYTLVKKKKIRWENNVKKM